MLAGCAACRCAAHLARPKSDDYTCRTAHRWLADGGSIPPSSTTHPNPDPSPVGIFFGNFQMEATTYTCYLESAQRRKRPHSPPKTAPETENSPFLPRGLASVREARSIQINNLRGPSCSRQVLSIRDLKYEKCLCTRGRRSDGMGIVLDHHETLPLHGAACSPAAPTP